MYIFACTPIRYFWDRNVEGGKCPIDILKAFNAQVVPNIVTDLVLLGMPMPLVWKLGLPRGQKVALCGIFALGGL